MKLGMIGCGKMGEAILAGLLRSGTVRAGDVRVCDKVPGRLEHLERTHGVGGVTDPRAAVAGADVVVVAVKPQDLDATAEGFADAVTARHLVVSIAAGKRLETICALFPAARVVRVMPNLPATVAMGMSAFCCADAVTESDKELVLSMLEAFGKQVELPEEQFDAFTALAGSGPAFVARLVQAMAEGAVALGMERDRALAAARQTFAGTAALLLNGTLDEDGLVAAVSSPGGTTVAGRAVLEASDLGAVLAATLEAAARRGAELAQEARRSR